ncbi:MAG: tetratricopeptide repeat protein [Candidatus Omnitrophota bacterium]
MAPMFLYVKKRYLWALFFCAAAVFAFSARCSAGETTPEEQLDFAHGLFQRGMYEMAIAEYEKFASSYPDRQDVHEAYFGIAESRFFSKAYGIAAPLYLNYIERFKDPEKTSIAALRIGQAYFLTDQFERAKRQFSSVKTEGLEGKFVHILFLYSGKAYRATGDNDTALKFFNKVISLPEKNEHTSFALLEAGDIHFEKAVYAEAAALYERAFAGADSGKIKSFALRKKGQAQFAGGDFSSAAETFRKSRVDYPDEATASELLNNLLSSLFNDKRYGEVIIEYERNAESLRDNGTYFTAHYIAASSYALMDRHDESLAVIDRILSSPAISDDDRKRALKKEAEILIKGKRFSDAIQAIENRMKGREESADPALIFLKAEANYGAGSFDAAYDLYKAVVENHPDSSVSDFALYGMAFAMNSSGKDREARERFMEYYRLGKDDEKRQEALYNAIGLEIKLGMYDAAIGHCGLFLSSFKNSPLLERILFKLGSLSSETKRHEEAVKTFERFIQQYSGSEKLQEAYFLTAFNLQLLKKTDLAMKYYEKVSKSGDPSSLYYASLKNRALIFLKDEEHEKAAAAFNMIMSDFPDNDLGVEAHLWLGKFYISKKKYDDALRVLEQAGSKKDIAASMEIAYFKAEAYRWKKEYKRALEYYTTAVSSPENNVYIGASRIGKGLCLVSLGDLASAKAEFEAAIEEYPDDNTITMRSRFELAGIERMKGNLEESVKLYMLVTILYQDDHYCPEALFLAGEILESRGKTKESLSAYREITNSFKSSPRYEEARKKVTALDI